MTDLIFVAALIALLLLCRLYVPVCARAGALGRSEAAAIGGREGRESGSGNGALGLAPVTLAVGVPDWISLGAAVLLIAYLIVALMRPERF